MCKSSNITVASMGINLLCSNCRQVFEQRFSSYALSCMPITSRARTEAIEFDSDNETESNTAFCHPSSGCNIDSTKKRVISRLYQVFVGFHFTQTAKQTSSH